MTTGELVIVIIVFILATVMVVLAIIHFLQKGFLLNNAYLYASKDERKTMNKKPYYIQSAISFCILSGVFIVSGLTVIFHNDKLLFIEIPLIVGIIVYAIVSSIWIKNNRR